MLNIRKGIKKLISYAVVLVMTVMYVGTALVLVPGNAEEVASLTFDNTVRTYNIKRLDDQPEFANCGAYMAGTNSRFSWMVNAPCSDAPSDEHGNHVSWWRQAASFYGYYDLDIESWIITGVAVYGGIANRIGDSNCGHAHIAGDSTFEPGNGDAWIYSDQCRGLTVNTTEKIKRKGGGYLFSNSCINGTVTVSMPQSYYIVAVENTQLVLTQGSRTTLETASGSMNQRFYVVNEGSGLYSFRLETSEDSDYTPALSWRNDSGSWYLTCDNFKAGNDAFLWGLTDSDHGGIRIWDKSNGFNFMVRDGRLEKGNDISIGGGGNGTSFIFVKAKSAVTFYPDNGADKYSKVMYYGKGSNNLVSVPTYDGYIFNGWYTEVNGKGRQVFNEKGDAVEGSYWTAAGSAGIWTGTADMSLYAGWTAASTDVTLCFYKDGVKDASKTRTYSVKNGTTFSTSEHVGDSAFEHCHYVSVDRTSWTVPGEVNSANVYYESDVLKISYNGNGNTGGSTSETTAKYGARMTVANNGFTKTGCSFNGWNTKSDGTGTSYTAGSQFDAQPSYNGETITVYAQWKPDRYNVTLNKGTGISSVSGAGSYVYGSEVSIDATPGTGYSWDKWTGSAETTAKNYRFNIGAGDVSFTANATPNSYIVSFDANGGSCVNSQGQTVQSVTVTYDSGSYNDISGLVSASRNGYKFAGWKVGQSSVWDDKGLAVNGDYWSGNGNSAKWRYADNAIASAAWIDISPPTVSASPDSTTDYVTSLNVTVTAADNEALAGDSAYEYCLCTDSNSPAAGAAWTGYTSGSAFTVGSGLSGTYYLWVRHVKDAAGNTSVSSPNTDYHRFGPYYFDSTAPDLSEVGSSYGWYSEGTAITFNISDAHAGIAGAVLTDFNGVPLDNGDITDSRQFYFSSEGAAFYCLTVTDRLGNTARKLFNVKIDQKGEVIPDNAVWKGLSDITLFAHWSANSYKVHFEKNDNDSGSTRATGSMSDVTFTYDKSETLPANGFSRTGYAFDGWNRSADGTADNGVNYPDGGTVRNLTLIPGGTATLYAQWKPLGYMLAFDYSRPGNATGDITGADEASRKVTFDSSIGRLPEPRLTGWVFEGWYVDGTIVNGSYMGGTKLKGDDIWNYTSDKTAFAKWTPVKYEVRLHSSVPAEALGTLVKPSDSGLTASGWTWKENEYYSAVFTYDTESLLPAAPDTYSIVYTAGGQGTTEYVINGWYRNKLLSDYTCGGETRKWNFSAADGVVIELYPSWRDTSAPVIDVTPAHTVNPDADNDAVRSIDITITVTEHGSGLRTDNCYEYGFSASASALPSEWESYGSAAPPSGFTTSLPDLGASMDGCYYLWVRQVMDNSGSLSVSPSALATVNSCHVYGIYVFDNTAPQGTADYTENNLTLGLYNDSITDSPYAVMTIHDPHDDIAGIAGYVLRISDASDLANSVDHAFTPDDGSGTYICRFNLYDSLPNAEDIEQVRMCIVSKDKLGNEATIPITRYDFGTLQTGAAICAEDIGYRELSDIPDASSPLLSTSYKYIRDYFRVEAYIENISYKASGTTFMGGHKGQLKIYVFGYVDNVSADFGSIKKFILPAYDTNPDLSRTDIVPPEREKLYLHEFFVPLYCANSTYTDTTAFGYKGNSVQKRCVIYDVSDTLAYKIKTILKYNAR